MKGIVASLFSMAVVLSLPQAQAQTYTRTDTTAYEDNLSKWVIGQVKSSTNVDTGLIESQTDYDPTTALPIRTYAFGKLQQTLTYDTTSAVDTGQRGTLKTVTDGRNNTTTLSSWKRGIPQLIQFPATPESPTGSSKSAVVNDLGLIESVTDENGYTTSYTFDAMGRLTGIGYPSADTVAWTPKAIEFRAMTDADWKPPGFVTGQWRQYVAQGNYVKLTYFDAMWRPILSHEYDASNVAATLRATSMSYDSNGRLAFQSYPSSNLIPVQQGSRTFYDALDRVTRVEQDSELGVLATTTEYLTGFQTRVTNPRGIKTFTAYRAYDQPTYDQPHGIVQAEGTADASATEIYRDIFGKPVALRRRNGDYSLESWRRYVYDAHQRLCKVIEPETGASVMAYDGANNIQWSASGLTLPDVANCNEYEAAQSGRRVDRTYDARNRVAGLYFPDGQGNQTWTYTPDGLPASITTNNSNGGTQVINAYSYNKRRLLTGESVQQPGWYTWSLGYAYDANGNLTGQSYPTGLYVDYAPNALGQPTKAGTYATGVSYYPNGAIQQFSYGNGIVHTMTQNARQLPARSTDSGGALDDAYNYDANGNVDSIIDKLLGEGVYSPRSRWMSYDGLDRLTGVGAGMFGGTDNWHRFTYDALDNIKSWKLAGVKDYANYYYEPDTNRLTSIQNSAGASIVGLGYDVQGNLANKNGQLYSFDFGNRLRSATNLESYRYDGLGRRIESIKADGRLHLWQYSQAGQLMFGWTGPTNEATQEYVYLGGSLVAEIDHAWPSNTVTATKYQHTDALGSPVAVTDANRNVVERSEYEPYGKLLNRPIADGPGYTGHVMDAATGLTYMQQRYYDPGIGRFLSVDPVTADGNTGGNFNRYKYAANNPYKFTDPDGRLEAPNPQFFKGAAMGIIDTIVESATGMCGETVSVFGGADGDIAAGGYKFGHALGNAGLVMAPGRGVGGLVSTEGRVAKATVVTPAKVESALAGSTMQTTQNAVSLPVVQRYVNALENGSPAPAIKVADGVIVDGNHRYVAGRVAGQEPAVQAGTIAPSQVSQVKPIQEIKVDPTDWGNE